MQVLPLLLLLLISSTSTLCWAQGDLFEGDRPAAVADAAAVPLSGRLFTSTPWTDAPTYPLGYLWQANTGRMLTQFNLSNVCPQDTPFGPVDTMATVLIPSSRTLLAFNSIFLAGGTKQLAYWVGINIDTLRVSCAASTFPSQYGGIRHLFYDSGLNAILGVVVNSVGPGPAAEILRIDPNRLDRPTSIGRYGQAGTQFPSSAAYDPSTRTVYTSVFNISSGYTVVVATNVASRQQKVWQLANSTLWVNPPYVFLHALVFDPQTRTLLALGGQVGSSGAGSSFILARLAPRGSSLVVSPISVASSNSSVINQVWSGEVVLLPPQSGLGRSLLYFVFASGSVCGAYQCSWMVLQDLASGRMTVYPAGPYLGNMDFPNGNFMTFNWIPS